MASSRLYPGADYIRSVGASELDTIYSPLATITQVRKPQGDTVYPHTIDWSDKEPKRINDLGIYQCIKDELCRYNVIRCLTLPGSTWNFEMGLSSAIPKKKIMCLGIERDALTHKESMKRLQQISTWGHNARLALIERPTTLYTFLKESHREIIDKLNLIYVDWMGTWSVDKQAEIEQVFESSVLKKKSLLCFTIMLARGYSRMNDYLEQHADNETMMKKVAKLPASAEMLRLSKESPSCLRKVIGVSSVVDHIAERHGYNIEPLRIETYKSFSTTYKQHSMPEISFLFRVVRHTKKTATNAQLACYLKQTLRMPGATDS